MKYYVLTTAKFAQECIENNVYGSTNTNWLANIDVNDCVFISQFNYKSQNIYGPFNVTGSLFYDKNIIFPNQKFYYRIKIEPINLPTMIEETDLYLYGIKQKKADFVFRLISLIQQNKHLHSICLNNTEGKFILDTFNNIGKSIKIKTREYSPDFEKLKVDLIFLSNKNRLSKKLFFTSESDLESFITISLKDKNSSIHKQFSKIINNFSNNNLNHSEIYNQFIFGNAYPSDIVILNRNNVNIIELKKIWLDKSVIPTLEKEIKKYCLYSLYSDRLEENHKQINFILIVLKNENNIKFQKYLNGCFRKSLNNVSNLNKFSFVIVEYYIKNQKLLFCKL